jgi:hypothetical protein
MREKNHKKNDDLIKSILTGAIAGVIVEAIGKANGYQSKEDLEAEL